MVFASNLPMGGECLDEDVAAALQIPVEQAHGIRRKMIAEDADQRAEDELFRLLDGKISELAEKITHGARYYEAIFRNHTIDRVIFIGGQAHNKRLCQSIAKRLNLPAQVGDPLAGIQQAEQAGWNVGIDARQPNPSWAVAIGLSLGAMLAA